MLEYFEKVSATVTLSGGGGSYVDGEWTSDYEDPSSINIVAPQPLKSNELEMLEAGERKSNYLKTWVEEEILPRETLDDSAIITFNSKDYLVYQVDNWNEQGGFYRIVIREITDDESRYRV